VAIPIRIAAGAHAPAPSEGLDLEHELAIGAIRLQELEVLVGDTTGDRRRARPVRPSAVDLRAQRRVGA
jgi:hypothetical protein